MSFSRKKIKTNTLGDIFKEKRQDKNLDLKEVEKETGVIKKFLQYIEEGDFHKIAGYVYAKGAVLKYADFLDLDKDKVLEKFNEIMKPEKNSNICPPSSKEKEKPLFTFKTGVFLTGIALVLIYLGLNIVQVLAMPEIKVASPQKDLVTQKSSLLIKGQTEKGADVFINNQPIQVNKGSFKKTIELLPGVNTINISAKKVHSNKAEVVRKVLYKENKE